MGLALNSVAFYGVVCAHLTEVKARAFVSFWSGQSSQLFSWRWNEIKVVIVLQLDVFYTAY